MSAIRRAPEAVTARRPARTSRAALLLACCIVLGACSGAPRAVALADLRATPERYDGSVVAVTGTLRAFADPEHYWIENVDLDRVGLEGGGKRGNDRLRALVGWTVEVRGTFRYDRWAGRRIEVTAISSAR
ncbi:MAG: hypothetical protein V2J24_04385 [Pseudomonadales bacterium]|nr:hypothetical protein [Pseudomonadales bacterium]